MGLSEYRSMKKLLTLILGVVLFSGAAYAKIYWLPNYLQDNMDRSAGRVTEDTTNRTAGCSKGGYYNSPLGSGYNCSRVVYAHQACYSCTPKPCPSGQKTLGRTFLIDNTSTEVIFNAWSLHKKYVLLPETLHRKRRDNQLFHASPAEDYTDKKSPSYEELFLLIYLLSNPV